MKVLSIVVVSLLALSASAQASHELIKQPVVVEAPAHYDCMISDIGFLGIRKSI